MYISKTLHEENVHNNCLMGLIFLTSWRVAATKKKIVWGSGFLKNEYKSIGSSLRNFVAQFWGV